MNTLFFGNGLNRLSKCNPSWDRLISKISKQRFDNNIPNTMKYEAIIADCPYRQPDQTLITADGKRILTADGYILTCLGELTEDELKRKIANEVCKNKGNRVYNELRRLHFDHIVTTNYDNTFLNVEDVAIGNRDFSERLYSLKRKYEITNGQFHQTYWPIHGSCESYKSIMLGLDHYCGSIAKINDYIKGNITDINGKRQPSILTRAKDHDVNIMSWVDLFFFSDIHIIGFGLSYDETDIWWILNRRKRIIRMDGELINNTIRFYPTDLLSDDKRQLLSNFGIEIIDNINLSTSFKSRYMQQIKNMSAFL